MIGKFLRKKRKLAKLSKSEAAKQLHVTLETIINWERTIRDISIDDLFMLADFYHFEIDDLRGEILSPKEEVIVEKVSYNYFSKSEINNSLLLDYPSVYIVQSTFNKNIKVYVGETNNIEYRTKQHLMESREDWAEINQSSDAEMYIISNDKFNKSITLELEDRLMNYLMGSDAVTSINNRRGNPQGDYFPKFIVEHIFHETWLKLNKSNSKVFPAEEIVKNNALFKSSPFHELNSEQIEAKETIKMKLQEAIFQNNNSFIMVSGHAGTGKSVLISSLFFESFDVIEFMSNYGESVKGNLLVNHDEMRKSFKGIAKKLGVNEKLVQKPNEFINEHTKSGEVIDFVIVDEGHLLATRNGQAFPKRYGKTHLDVIKQYARVVVLVFDPNQILKTEQYVDQSEIQKLQEEARNEGNLIVLKKQMRMKIDKIFENWLTKLIDFHEILPIPNNLKYDFKIFDDPLSMYAEIKEKNQEYGLSRMLATYDWEWKIDSKTNFVEIGDFKLPWNYGETKKNAPISWPENNQTINEVGSTFTIQGFDLNYSGVIIGPSVKYDKLSKKIYFDKNASYNTKATEKRKLADGKKIEVFDQNLNNELNILLTRGIKGLFIYAVDDNLREALKNANK